MHYTDFDLSLEDTIKLFFEKYYSILTKQKFPAFSIKFENDKDRIKLDTYLQKNFKDEYDVLKEYVLSNCKKENNNGNPIPTIHVKDFHHFFDLLRKYCIRISTPYQTAFGGRYNQFRIQDTLQYIWLRATDYDFKNIEKFLEKQVQMAKYSRDSRFINEYEIGKIPFLECERATIQCKAAELYDERPLEFIPKLYYDGELIELPRVRYGIFEKDGKAICSIGSVQDKENKKNKKLERIKYKINKDIKPEYLNVEPKKVISLILFISLMNSMGIKDFEFPGFNVLDYDFHKILSEVKQKEFQRLFPEGKTPEDFKYFEKCKKELNRYSNHKKIVESKTIGMSNLAFRIIRHFTNGETYPSLFESDSSFTLTISEISREHINSDETNQLFSAASSIFQPLDYSIEDTYDENNLTFDITKLKELAIHGNGLACYILGLINEWGVDGGKRDNSLAELYYNMGMAQNDSRCQIHSYEKFSGEESYFLKIEDLIAKNKNSSFLERKFLKIAGYIWMNYTKGSSAFVSIINNSNEPIVNKYLSVIANVLKCKEQKFREDLFNKRNMTERE